MERPMIFLVVVGSVLLGGTTWLALQQAVAAHPARNHRLAAAGLVLCLISAAAALAGVVIQP
jgi:DMSO reductase anchor subunit